MPSYVVETYVPSEARARFTRTVAALRAASEGAPDALGIRHVRSFLVPGDEMGFHVLEAGTAIEISRLAEAAGIEIERVVEVVPIDGPEWEETR
jgi:hypothetical protein